MSDIKFIETDPNQIKSNIITTYESISGYTLYPGDPRRLFLQSLAQIIIQQRTLINFTAKQNLLKYAEGEYLDELGNDVNLPRLEPVAAKTTMRLTISSIQSSDYIFPKGLRGTPDGKIFFETTKDAVVPAGDQYVDIEAECTTLGTIGNGFISGQINKIVDPHPLLQSLVNITESQGGTDTEDDESYRERIRQKEETYSTAGPDEAYIYWAKSASTAIIDVSVSSPGDGQVEIRVLMEGGEMPTADTLNDVLEACNDRIRRPLTDQVTALAPIVINYDIDLQYWIDEKDATRALEIQKAVNEAIEEYELWQKSKLGRDIDPSELIFMVKSAGAKRVQVNFPAYQDILKTQVAVALNKTITYQGLES